MIYLDTSIALAHLLAEDRRPDDSLWRQSLVSSRLLVYEARNRLNARGLDESHGPLLEELTERLAILELRPRILERALRPFPRPVRTLDALHLASAVFLKESGFTVELATYDSGMATAAEALGLRLADYPPTDDPPDPQP